MYRCARGQAFVDLLLNISRPLPTQEAPLQRAITATEDVCICATCHDHGRSTATRHGELALVQSHGQLVALQLGRACDGDVGIRLQPHRVSAASPHIPRPRYCRPSSIFCPPHTFMHSRACVYGCCALTNTFDCTTCNTREDSTRLTYITSGWSSLTKPLAWRLSS